MVLLAEEASVPTMFEWSELVGADPLWAGQDEEVLHTRALEDRMRAAKSKPAKNRVGNDTSACE